MVRAGKISRQCANCKCMGFFVTSKTSRAKLCPTCVKEKLNEYRRQMKEHKGKYWRAWCKSMRCYAKSQKGK